MTEKSDSLNDSPDTIWDSARRQIGNGLLSVVMPAYNLGHTIADNIQRVHALLNNHVPFEIVVINDGSTDLTALELAAAASRNPSLLIVNLAHNIGKGGALKRGFEASQGSHILFLDADMDLPPEQMSGFFKIMEDENADVVIGSKRHPDSVLEYPMIRKLASAVYFGLVKLLVGLPIHDTQTGIKLFKRSALEWAMPRMLVKRFAFDLELLAIIHEKNFRVAEAPVTLEFHARWGSMRVSSVKQVMTDTLGIFYRLRLLRYYQSIPDAKMPSPPPMVSVIIAYPAPTSYLDECLKGVQSQTYKNYEIILLPDENSNMRWPACVREIATGKLRPAEKRNIGLSQAHGSIIAFLDDDASPLDDWLQQALVHFSDSSIAAVGGPATTPGNDPYMARLGGRVLINHLVSGKYRYRYEPERVREIDDYPSCNLLVRASIMKELDGFRTDYWPGEDTILCSEIVHKLRYRILYDPRVVVHHHRRKLFLPHLRQIGRYALHRGHFARRFPATSRRLSYFIPTLLVLGLILGGAASLFCNPCRILYLSAVAIYCTATFLSCFTRRLDVWLLTWFGVMLTHITYGSRYLVGLLSTKIPGSRKPFDHASENLDYNKSTGESNY
ncbi:MAG: glycosyltransferase [Lentisphaerae bacterium]|nr:glycosyltransferase [Lentisphaerota bacterium]